MDERAEDTYNSVLKCNVVNDILQANSAVLGFPTGHKIEPNQHLR